MLSAYACEALVRHARSLAGNHREASYKLTIPGGVPRKFCGIIYLGQWANAYAIGSQDAEWLRNGENMAPDA